MNSNVNYHIVGNFHEGFIFTFFVSLEPFAKIKTEKFVLPTRKASELCFSSLIDPS